jgi:hypothetical protein
MAALHVFKKNWDRMLERVQHFGSQTCIKLNQKLLCCTTLIAHFRA